MAPLDIYNQNQEWEIIWTKEKIVINEAGGRRSICGAKDRKIYLLPHTLEWEHWQLIRDGDEYFFESAHKTYLAGNQASGAELSNKPEIHERW